ncbi:helix-turn-helix transcriptional regulator [uncultured Treponema sp.]|uniref:helix-turn-helix domain-containing protein n=1 Tax=uncultured Treponema sp. TaxID=162155 RepID=UPI0025EB545D|nr:helix-turn-helix transcriptional regulator [uncultured Treponema sp.]
MNEIPIEIMLKTNIRRLRTELGWSQEKLAEKAEISPSYVTQIELGNRSPSIDIIEKIAIALGIEYRILFTPEDLAKKEYCKSLRLLEKNVMQAVNEAIQKEFQK